MGAAGFVTANVELRYIGNRLVAGSRQVVVPRVFLLPVAILVGLWLVDRRPEESTKRCPDKPKGF